MLNTSKCARRSHLSKTISLISIWYMYITRDSVKIAFRVPRNSLVWRISFICRGSRKVILTESEVIYIYERSYFQTTARGGNLDWGLQNILYKWLLLKIFSHDHIFSERGTLRASFDGHSITSSLIFLILGSAQLPFHPKTAEISTPPRGLIWLIWAFPRKCRSADSETQAMHSWSTIFWKRNT